MQALHVAVQTEVIVPLTVLLLSLKQQVQGGAVAMEMDGRDSTTDIVDGLRIQHLTPGKGHFILLRYTGAFQWQCVEWLLVDGSVNL